MKDGRRTFNSSHQIDEGRRWSSSLRWEPSLKEVMLLGIRNTNTNLGIRNTIHVFKIYLVPFITTVPIEIFVVKYSSLVTLLSIKLQIVFDKMFERIFITWYFKKRINRRVDRFF